MSFLSQPFNLLSPPSHLVGRLGAFVAWGVKFLDIPEDVIEGGGGD